MIQKFWRFRYRQRLKIAANKIGMAYKDYKARLEGKCESIRILRMRIQLYKLKRWLRLMVKKQRI